MVSTSLFSTSLSGVWQERTALPSTITVQAPHRPLPQPYFVPVSSRSVRSTHSSVRSPSVSSVVGLPFRRNRIDVFTMSTPP